MHYVVNEQYKKGIDLPTIYNQCTSACYGACYHGGLEGYFINKNLQGASIDKINNEVLTICNDVTKMRGQCYHGLGHALMLVYNGELIESLKSCDLLGNNASLCYEGVFMENVPNTATQQNHPIKYIRVDDPLYPCNILEERYAPKCYEYQTSLFIYLAQSDWRKAGEYCNLVPKEYFGLCFQRIGSTTIDSSFDFDYPNWVCAHLPEGLPEEYCVRGVIDSFHDRFSGDNEKLIRMIDFCPTAKTAYQKACFDQVGDFLSRVPVSTQQIACSKIDNPEFRNLCLRR